MAGDWGSNISFVALIEWSLRNPFGVFQMASRLSALKVYWAYRLVECVLSVCLVYEIPVAVFYV